MEQKKINKRTLYSLTAVWCTLLLAVLSGGGAYCQDNLRQQCLKVMKDMVEKYRDSRYLSFNITYRYSSEQAPDAGLDSLKGHYRMNGSDYWYSLDSTEVASYHGTCVLLFKEDHIMYLSPGGAPAQRVDFLAAMDSLLSQLANVSPVVSEEGAWRIVLLQFGPKSARKSIEYTIDKTSGFITRIRQVVKSDQLYDPGVRGKIDGEIPYAIVDMFFSDYQSGAFDDRGLDTAKYFKKEGQEYVSVSPYDEYKIFLGAPNL